MSMLSRTVTRNAGLTAWADSLRADVVFGWRQLKKRKLTSIVAILSLGIALGACATVFRLADALFLRPLPISNPQNVYELAHPNGQDFWEHTRFVPLRDSLASTGRANNAELIAVSGPEQTDVAYPAQPQMEKAYVQYVSGWMFESFGLRPARGRELNADDDFHPVAVLSFDLWTRRFGRDPKVVGSTAALTSKYGMGSTLFEIVGIAPEGFSGTEPGSSTDIFVPATMHPLVNLPVAQIFRIFVRVPPAFAPEAVRDRLTAALRTIDLARAKQLSNRPNSEPLVMEPAGAGISGLQKKYRQSLAALGILVGLVLLIAIVNVANLMSAQAAARTREMALRISIGAGRIRLIQLVVVQGAIVACLAAAVGSLLAWWAAPFVVERINPPDNPAHLALSPDWRLFVFGLALTSAATLLFGLLPALRISGVKPASALKGGENPRSIGRLIHGLIAAQVAFSFFVLFIAGLFAATFHRLSHQPLGFRSDGLFALDTVTPRDEPPSAWQQVAQHLRTVPGVEAAALSEWPLLDGHGFRFNDVSIEGAPPDETNVRFLLVSPGWVDAMKIPLIGGRDFRPNETRVAIVNQAFAAKFFPGQSPLGRNFEAKPGGDWGRRFQIVAVVGDTRYRLVRDPIAPIAYVPYNSPWHAETLLVRTSISNPPCAFAGASNGSFPCQTRLSRHRHSHTRGNVAGSDRA